MSGFFVKFVTEPLKRIYEASQAKKKRRLLRLPTRESLFIRFAGAPLYRINRRLLHEC